MQSGGGGITINTGGDASVTTRLAAVEAAVVDMPTRDLNVMGDMVSWLPSPVTGWPDSAAMSSDGRIQVVVGCVATGVPQRGFISESADYGVSWVTVVGTNRSWDGIAVDASGTRQVALCWGLLDGTTPYYSTNAGATWAASACDTAPWTCCAMSMDGATVVAGSDLGGLYLSTNGGVSFVAIPALDASAHVWTDVAVSSNGQYVLASCALRVLDEDPHTEYDGGMYVSTNWGVTWAVKQAVRDFSGVAMSADGSRQAGVGENGRIYQSADHGASWTEKGPSLKWRDLTMSGDGRRQIAVCYNGLTAVPMYMSSDYGETWSLTGRTARWGSACLSKDGAYALVTAVDGGVWASHAMSRIHGGLAVEGALGLGALGQLMVMHGTQLVFVAGGVTNVIDADILNP
jgi:hypothetical protein